jgi:hypothetical protein
MTIEILRSLERILGVMIGGLSIYLGFRLFLALPKKTDGAGRLVLPGGISVYLSRVGPGTFFALFGCALVLISFRQAVTIEHGRGAADGTNALNRPASGDYDRYHGAASGSGLTKEEQAVRLTETRIALADLNRLGYPLLTNLPANERRMLRSALERGKLALARSVWVTNWGSFDEFEKWVREGNYSPLPDSRASEARDMFNQGQPANPP